MDINGFACPIPVRGENTVQLAHGGGGRLMQELLHNVIVPPVSPDLSACSHDGVVLDPGPDRMVAFTTDSFVVRPLFFPGGDIGTLAINGTANDLAMCGAQPRWLSLSLILEEGFPLETLERVMQSLHQSAEQACVSIVTGDTKVVDRGRGDGIYMNTAGIGLLQPGVSVSPANVQPGDAVIVSGDLGCHGIAVMAVREGLEFETTIESDCAPLWPLVAALLQGGVSVRCLRDLTRGGLASGANEIASQAGVSIHIEEEAVPVREEVRGACELLGLDPLYVANEGRFVLFCPEHDADKAVSILRTHSSGVGSNAARIGTVQPRELAPVLLKGRVGVGRVLDMLSGEQLPRIC